MSDTALTDADRELLNAVQWDFPLEGAPYAVLGERLGPPEPEVRARVVAVKDAGVLRQLSAIFDTRALGYHSSLVAAKIDTDRVDEAAAVISDHPGVSHNYKRNHAFNLWYTIVVPPGESLDEHLDVLHRESGAIVTRKLPTLQLYKIGVKLDMTGKTAANAKVAVVEHERPERREHMDAPELSDLEVAAIRVVQEDLPLVERPFAAQGEQLGCSEDQVLELLRSFKTRKLMRRFVAVMNHRSAGFKANVMGVLGGPRGPPRRARSRDRRGSRWSATATDVRRTRTGRTRCSRWSTASTAATGRKQRSPPSRRRPASRTTRWLWSVKEYKKTRVRYFTSEWQDWDATHLAASGAEAATR